MVPFGEVPVGLVVSAWDAVEPVFGLPCRTLAPQPLPAAALDAARGQYSSRLLLAELLRLAPAEARGALGVTEADLFLPVLTFVFGEAQLGGRAAVVSLCRLREELYLRPPQPVLLLARLRKEIVHELGHGFGLAHCRDERCAMRPSSTVGQTDAKNAALCFRCATLLGRTR
ncbi:MAG: archaemetzincin family Zn-dependent metalloprotease [Deltaproteobacteria bacterium]|nr:archaemetzincin family Zn-dependent metalloprotease [Deltaproteobacteria bacterium]